MKIRAATAARRRLVAARPTPVGAAVVTLMVVGVLQLRHAGLHAGEQLHPVLHWLRDSVLGLPIGVLGVRAARLAARAARRLPPLERALWSSLAGVRSWGSPPCQPPASTPTP